MRRLAVTLTLLLLACHDAGQDTLKVAKGQYEALLTAGTPAQSLDFLKVKQTLDSIPSSSRAYDEARKLSKAIDAARGQPIGRPLAVVATPVPDLGAPELQRQLEAARAECERLAKDLSGAEGDERKHKLEVLDACRRRVDDLSDAIAHSEPDGGAPP